MLQDLLPQAERIAAKLKARNETISIAESSTAGMISAALLAIAGASAYFMGGAVVYTRQSRSALLAVTDQELTGITPSTEALCAAVRPQDPRQAGHHLVGRRDRHRRTDRQPLRPRRRAFLHRRDRPQWRALDDRRDRQGRPRRQHAHVLDGRTRPAGKSARLRLRVSYRRSPGFNKRRLATNVVIRRIFYGIAACVPGGTAYLSGSRRTRTCLWPMVVMQRRNASFLVVRPRGRSREGGRYGCYPTEGRGALP